MAPHLSYRRFRAPRGDDTRLIDPSYTRCLTLPAENRLLLEQGDLEIAGRSFTSLRQAARAQVTHLATEYSGHYSDPLEDADFDGPLILTGHQPELFHPGVWAKNFAIDDLARQLGGFAIHIVIDNDDCRSNSIRVPSGILSSPHVRSVPFDQYAPPQPYELRSVLDPQLFASFASRIARELHEIVPEPLIAELWPHAIEFAHDGAKIGHAIAAARHRIERAWGLQTLEVPLSEIADTTEFRYFAVDLLLRAEQVRATMNQTLYEYRTIHRLRTVAQPVPDLRITGGWIETPFWVWSDDRPERQALWFRRDVAGRAEIGDGDASTWDLGGCDDPKEMVAMLGKLRSRGVRVRPRAITNTIFARLFVGDLFIHGIGGAKYDQVTDQLIAKLYNVDPPTFMTLSLTAWLPTGHTAVDPRATSQARDAMRQIHHHPERFLTSEQRQLSQVSYWISKKKAWLSSELPRGARLARHLGITEANRQLMTQLGEKTCLFQQNIELAQQRAQVANILESREWSIGLFPPEFLRSRLLAWHGEGGNLTAE